jgi:predicted ester cyclase
MAGETEPARHEAIAPEVSARLQANKNLARRVIEEVIDGADLDLADELIAEDYVEHRPTDDTAPGREGLKRWVKMVHAAFPDWRHTIDDLVAEGDKVVVRNTLFGTHRGEFMGIAPTGKQIRQAGFDLFRIQDGKVIEHWGEYDWMGFFQQLRVVPEIGKQSG